MTKDEALNFALENGAFLDIRTVDSVEPQYLMSSDELLAFANAISEKASAAQMEKWTEVNSIFLPPSGRTVLAFDGKRVVRATWVAKFTDDHVSDEGDFYDYRESDDTYWLPEGWYERIDHWGDYDMVHINSTVTHWMPLPASPDAILANKE